MSEKQFYCLYFLQSSRLALRFALSVAYLLITCYYFSVSVIVIVIVMSILCDESKTVFIASSNHRDWRLPRLLPICDDIPWFLFRDDTLWVFCIHFVPVPAIIEIGTCVCQDWSQQHLLPFCDDTLWVFCIYRICTCWLKTIENNLFTGSGLEFSSNITCCLYMMTPFIKMYVPSCW